MVERVIITGFTLIFLLAIAGIVTTDFPTIQSTLGKMVIILAVITAVAIFVDIWHGSSPKRK